MARCVPGGGVIPGGGALSLLADSSEMLASSSVVLLLVFGVVSLVGSDYVANVMISASCVLLFGFGQSRHF